MSADRELLELAAKAAGMHVLPAGQEWPREKIGWFYSDSSGFPVMCDRGSRLLTRWSPLTDDGDALRLAVKLRMQVAAGTFLEQSAMAFAPVGVDVKEHVHYQQDMLAAIRRAIVRAAAEIGKAMP